MNSTRPGVRIAQTRAAAETPLESPVDLNPVILGIAREVIDLRTTTGLLNASALYTDAYAQVGFAIPADELPSPRDNIAQVTVENDSVRLAFDFGGQTREIARGSHGGFGSGFLAFANRARKAAIRSTVYDTFTFDSSVGDRLLIAFDRVNPANITADVTVTLVGELTAAEVVSAINDQVGATVASVITHASHEYVQIASEIYGAASSVTLRAGASALGVLFGDIDTSIEYRVVGSGFYASDDGDGDLLSPWIAFQRGGYYENRTQEDFNAEAASDSVWAVLIDLDDIAYTASAAVVSFSGANPTIALRAATTTRPGDVFMADRQVVGGAGAEVCRVEESRFQLGRIDPNRSTYTDGELTRRVYTTIEHNLLISGTPFAPTRGWFIANGLRFGDYVEGDPATITGSVAASAARPAMILGDTISFPLEPAGLTLVATVAIDGEGSDQTFRFPGGSIANLADLVDALTGAIDGVTFTGVNGRLLATTTETGAAVLLTISAAGTANSALGFDTADDTSDGGADPSFGDAAVLTSTSITLPLEVDAVFELVVVDSKGTHTLASTEVALDAHTTMGALATRIAQLFGGSSSDWTIYEGGVSSGQGGIPVATISLVDCVSGDGSGKLRITTVERGSAITLTLTAAGSGDGFYETNFDDTSEANGANNLTGEVLEWTADDSTQPYSLTLTSESLYETISAINTLVGATVASADSGRHLVLVSTLVGTGSTLSVNEGDAQSALGLTSSDTVGDGRPLPDFFVDDNGVLHVGPNILRDPSTGRPYPRTSVNAPVYIGYQGVRRDISALGEDFSDLPNFTTVTAAEEALGPFDTRNPLGLALSLAIAAAAGRRVYALAVDEDTYDGWVRGLEFLSQRPNIHGIAALTFDTYVHGALLAHVTAHSTPNSRMERMGYIAAPIPTRAISTTLASSTGGETNGSDNSFTLDVNPGSAVAGAGIDIGTTIPYSDQLYLEMRISDAGATELRRYSVSRVIGSVLTLRTTFSASENLDGFYTTETLAGDMALVNQSWSLFVRGDQLLIAGTTRRDLSACAEAAAEQYATYSSTRMSIIAADAIDISVGGVVTLVPSWYAVASFIGMVTSAPDGASITRRALTGVGRVYGTDNVFGPDLLSTISDAGRLVLVADEQAQAVVWQACTSQPGTDVETQVNDDKISARLRAALSSIPGDRLTNEVLNWIAATMSSVMKRCHLDGLCEGYDNAQVSRDETNRRLVIVRQPYTQSNTLTHIDVNLVASV